MDAFGGILGLIILLLDIWGHRQYRSQ